METFNISAINTYNIPNLYNEQTKKPVYTHSLLVQSSSIEPKYFGSGYKPDPAPEDQTNKSADISFSVEEDLNVIVTVFKDPNTKKVIRQIPQEEAIRRMKFIDNYLASLPDNSSLNDAPKTN